MAQHRRTHGDPDNVQVMRTPEQAQRAFVATFGHLKPGPRSRVLRPVR